MDVVSTTNSNVLYNIFPESFELQLYKSFLPLKNLGCDYFYFLVSESGMTHRFCTNDDWIDLYHDEKFILNDPLKRIAEMSSFIVSPWSQITCSNSKDKKSMEGRKSFGIYNGITIVRKRNDRKYIFALASEAKDHDLARYILLEKKDTLQEFIQKCIESFDRYLFINYSLSRNITNIIIQ